MGICETSIASEQQCIDYAGTWYGTNLSACQAGCS
jgi:hypothetical protein